MISVYGTLWNLLLATIPVVLAACIVFAHRRLKTGQPWLWWPIIGVLGVLWLAWLPNTCYLMTEWRHLLEIVDQENLAVQAAYQPQLYLRIGMLATFYLLYSLFGTLALVVAIRPIELILRRYGVKAWMWAIPLNVMLSIGVYLGLILRFNSWDLWSRPRHVMIYTLQVLERPALVATILFYALLLWAIYEAIDLWIDGVMDRVHQFQTSR